VKSNVAFHPLVETDAADAAEWYERQQAGLGPAFVAEYRDRLRHLPDEALPRFPYGIFYSLVDDGMVVLGILHGHRDSEAELARRRKFFG
jgi:hypothetical protein